MIPLVKYKQKLASEELNEVEKCLEQQLYNIRSSLKLKQGQRVGITVGSRGICNLNRIIKTVVNITKSWGLLPFIIPAMGSHGGATAEGQKELIAGYGISEETMECPIVSSMEVEQVGVTKLKTPVYLSKTAIEADAIILINRIKPHTLFSGPVESGLMKMTVVGLGKHKGALSFHSEMKKQHPSSALEEMARILFCPGHVIFGIGIVENAYDHTAEIQVIPTAEIVEKEKAMLVKAKGNMPHIPCKKFDLLIVDEIGKNISGAGMDPNIVGRYWGQAECEPLIGRIFVRRASKQTHGNVLGIGRADFTTNQVVSNIDYSAMYANSITSGFPESARIPIHFATDKEVLHAAAQSLGKSEIKELEIIWIKNTLEISELMMSPSLVKKFNLNPKGVIGDSLPMELDEKGNLIRPKFSFE